MLGAGAQPQGLDAEGGAGDELISKAISGDGMRSNRLFITNFL